MLKTPESAMPRTRKVTTVCNGRHEVWSDYEQAKAYFLEMMMTTDGEEHERAECVSFSYFMGLTSAAMRTNNQQGELFRQLALAMPSGERKSPSQQFEPAERKTNRLKRKDLRSACVSKSQVFVCYSDPKGYAVIVARAIILI